MGQWTSYNFQKLAAKAMASATFIADCRLNQQFWINSREWEKVDELAVMIGQAKTRIVSIAIELYHRNSIGVY